MTPDQLTSTPPTDEREHRIKQAVSSLFQHCSQSKNPVLSFSRACSKVGFLANDGVRGDLFHLTAAINEQKHLLLQQRYGNTEAAIEHAIHRDQELRAFARAVRRELQRGPEQPLRLLRSASGLTAICTRASGIERAAIWTSF
jgi:hypothetical protein